MPKTGRSRSRAALDAVAMVPRQHAAPMPCVVALPSSPRSLSGRAGAVGARERTTVAAVAFVLGFATCYLVLKYPAAPEPIPAAQATISGIGAVSRVP